MKAPSNKAAKQEERKQRILKAAEAVFLEKGFHAASMIEIAKAADVSAPHLYNFYENKGALAHAVQRQMSAESFKKLEETMSGASQKDSFCPEMFDPHRTALILTALAESIRNPEIRRHLREDGACLKDCFVKAYGYAGDNEEGQARAGLVAALYLGIAIENIFSPIKDETFMRGLILETTQFIMGREKAADPPLSSA